MKLRGIWGSIIGGGGLGGLLCRMSKTADIRGIVKIVYDVISRGAISGIARIEACKEAGILGRVKVCVMTPDVAPRHWKNTGGPESSQWSSSHEPAPQEWKKPQVCVYK